MKPDGLQNGLCSPEAIAFCFETAFLGWVSKTGCGIHPSATQTLLPKWLTGSDLRVPAGTLRPRGPGLGVSTEMSPKGDSLGVLLPRCSCSDMAWKPLLLGGSLEFREI